jgi:hypothetical protein
MWRTGVCGGYGRRNHSDSAAWGTINPLVYYHLNPSPVVLGPRPWIYGIYMDTATDTGMDEELARPLAIPLMPASLICCGSISCMAQSAPTPALTELRLRLPLLLGRGLRGSERLCAAPGL